jgi:hypothetical protein
MSILAAMIAAAGSAVARSGVGDGYGRETVAFVNQGIAQDIVNRSVVSPAIVVLVLLAGRGSMIAYLRWVGAKHRHSRAGDPRSGAGLVRRPQSRLSPTPPRHW